MPKQPPAVTLTTLPLNRAEPTPLYRQVYAGVRAMILRGQLRAGTRLPSTRDLATEMDLSRATVQNAFEQLLAEGYLQGRIGAGTYVADVLPHEQWSSPRKRATVNPTPRGRTVSERGELLLQVERSLVTQRLATRHNAFRVGLSAVDEFPKTVWARLLARRWRQADTSFMRYHEAAGYQPLREAIAAYIGAARGVRCQTEQVIIVAGSQQALDLSARVLLNPGDDAWIEDPGYLGARGALLSAGAQLVAVPVDENGLVVNEGIKRSPSARLAYISPSHQYPLGVTLSLARRLALLGWANQTGAWILEDDYDSEYRFSGRPLAALQGLDNEGRVIYIGTFSKTLFPALRLGYVVVPTDLIDVFAAARFVADRHSSVLEQATLADFIADGHFARHIRRMRALYAERQSALLEAAQHELAGLLQLVPAETGMHLTGWLPKGVDDRWVAKQAAEQDVEVSPLSWHCLTPPKRGALLLGYGAVNAVEIRAGVKRLAKALR